MDKSYRKNESLIFEKKWVRRVTRGDSEFSFFFLIFIMRGH